MFLFCLDLSLYTTSTDFNFFWFFIFVSVLNSRVIDLFPRLKVWDWEGVDILYENACIIFEYITLKHFLYITLKNFAYKMLNCQKKSWAIFYFLNNLGKVFVFYNVLKLCHPVNFFCRIKIKLNCKWKRKSRG